jgi:membrane associated rhomboid family serine protease
MNDVDFCYRHSDRATGAHCTRCGRAICADCMIQAPVGHHCPTCVKEGNKGVRQINWQPSGMQLGGGLTSVVKILIATNVAVFLLTSSHTAWELKYAQLGSDIALHHSYYRLLTATFIHANLFHILGNMMGLLIVGSPVEGAIGKARFTTLYFLAALGGSTASYLFAQPNVFGVGASGAVFGLFGAYFVLARSRRADTSGILVLLGLNLALSFTNRAIDWRAHVGGLVVGTLVALLITVTERRPEPLRRIIQIAGFLVILAGLIVAIQLRTDHLRALLTPMRGS